MKGERAGIALPGSLRQGRRPRPGRDVTVVGIGGMLPAALRAAELLVARVDRRGSGRSADRCAP